MITAAETIERGDPAFEFELSVKQDGLWLIWSNRNEAINLGHPEDVFERFAEKMAEVDFGE